LRAFRGFMEGFSGHLCWDHFEAKQEPKGNKNRLNKV